jgi:hypothetical protein
MSYEQELESSPYYMHRDGGLYRYEGTSTSTVDGSEWVLYKHIWPFEPRRYHRPKHEWTGNRFRQVPLRECHRLMHYTDETREEAQARIAAARAKRKSQEHSPAK